jgi:transcriptional regulator with XRE-family HTH domain
VEIMSNNEFGKFITEKRKLKKISLRGMAELLELSPAYWSDIEKGRRNPPKIDKLEELSNILELSQQELDKMIDMASEGRGEIPMDLPEYIKNNELAKVALRKASRIDNIDDKVDVTNKAWEEFIKALDEES